MARISMTLVLVCILCSSLAGCMFNREGGEISLDVEPEITKGTIIESYSEGELISSNSVSIGFDFQKTRADNRLATFGIDLQDGREPFTINAEEAAIVSIDFTNHGIYNILAYAVDDAGNQANTSIQITIDLRIDWTETDTANPQALPFNPEPENAGQHPKMIEIISNVENPAIVNNIGDSGQQIKLTWQLVDELDDICQTRNGQINDGDAMQWQTIYFNTFMEHELRIILDDSQDNVNVNQSIMVLYEN